MKCFVVFADAEVLCSLWSILWRKSSQIVSSFQIIQSHSRHIFDRLVSSENRANLMLKCWNTLYFASLGFYSPVRSESVMHNMSRGEEATTLYLFMTDCKWQKMIKWTKSAAEESKRSIFLKVKGGWNTACCTGKGKLGNIASILK